MNRILLIPIGGTIAAIVAVAIAHGERKGTGYPLAAKPPPLVEEAPPKEELPGDEPPTPADKAAEDGDAKKAPLVRRYLMQLNEDGTFAVTAELVDQNLPKQRPASYASIDEFLESAAPEGGHKPLVHLFAASDKVDAAALEKVAEKLRERCEVRVLGG